jgi:uncharacterized protein DUF2604
MPQSPNLTFIINGASYPLSANPNEPLHAAISQVLAQSGNATRPANEWVASDASGTVFDQSKRIGQLSSTTIFLSLSAGVGG